MTATLKNPSVKYKGSATGVVKVLKSDIELVDAKTKADLSNYLAVDKNGYVNVYKNNVLVNPFVALIYGVPTTGNKNYKITGGATSESGRQIQSTNDIEIENRDLSTVEVTIDPVQVKNNNANIQLSDINITYKDKETGESLSISGDVDVTIPTNTVKAGRCRRRSTGGPSGRQMGRYP